MSRVDACSLLSTTEIQSALGVPLRETKPSTQPAGPLYASQCVLLTSLPAKSVSLTVTTPSGPGASVREFWSNTFHSVDFDRDSNHETSVRPRKEAADSLTGDTESEQAGKPRRIDGIGDEAYWVGNRITGALYVLQGELLLRLSVGGIPSETARLAKSKALAAFALSHLRN